MNTNEIHTITSRILSGEVVPLGITGDIQFPLHPQFDGTRIEDVDLGRAELHPYLLGITVRLGVIVNVRIWDEQNKWSNDLPDIGKYSEDSDTITLRTTGPRSFAHEIAHAAHSRVLLDREDSLSASPHPWREVIADIASLAIVDRIGLLTESEIETCADYVLYWHKQIRGGITEDEIVEEVTGILDVVFAAEGVK